MYTYISQISNIICMYIQYIQVIDDRYLHEHTNIQTNIIFNQHSYIFESTKASDEYIHFYLGKEGRNGKEIGS